MLSRVAHENGRKKCCSQFSGNSEAAEALELTPLVRQGGGSMSLSPSVIWGEAISSEYLTE